MASTMDLALGLGVKRRRKTCFLESQSDWYRSCDDRGLTPAQTNPEEPPTPPRMEILPREILHDILSRLPITSLVQFRCVCRSWRAMARDPLLITSLMSSAIKNNDPCLILHCNFPIRNELHLVDFEAAENLKVKRIRTPFWHTMPEFDVVGSCNGLICLLDSLYNENMYVYNPLTRDYLELPKSFGYPDQEIVCGFGFNPKSNKYKVVRIVYYHNRRGHNRGSRKTLSQSELQVLTVGNPTWKKLGKVEYQFIRRHAEAFVKGRLHWITRRPNRYGSPQRVVSFDLDDEQFREVPKPDCGRHNRSNFHLVVIKDCLSAVNCNYGKIEIWVMKEYGLKESWVKEYSIGAHMPKEIKQLVESNSYRPLRTWNHNQNQAARSAKVARVLCVLRSGEVLLEYKNRAIVAYDPQIGKCKDVMLRNMPIWFECVVVLGSLAWIDTPFDS